MERKLVAIDLDGTTLNDHSQITHQTKATIRKVVEQGHIVSIATGRPYRTSHHFYRQLELDTPIVNFNGAWCHHPNDASWANSYHRSLDRGIALSLLPLSRFPIVKLIAAESIDRVYVDRPDEETYSMGSPLRDVPTAPFNEESLSEAPTSVNVFTAEEHFMPFVQDQIIEHHENQVEVRTWGGPTPTLEVVAAGIQKAMGLEAIADYYQIAREDIIAFGDQANDYEMIQYAGLGVVMKNGIDDLKEIANDVTSCTNNEDGLAKYLANYFGLQSILS